MDIDTLVEPALSGSVDFDAPLIEPRRLDSLAEASTPFVIELTQFSGPLDLLLSLIRDEQVDIYDIPIARIAEQFLAHIHLLQLDQAADYLEMAARLLRIKAQMLLRAMSSTTHGRIRARSLCVVCSSTNRCAKSSTCSSDSVRNGAADLRAHTCRSRSRRPWLRSRCRWPSCSRRSIACFAWRASRSFTTSSRVRWTSMARSRPCARYSYCEPQRNGAMSAHRARSHGRCCRRCWRCWSSHVVASCVWRSSLPSLLY